MHNLAASTAQTSQTNDLDFHMSQDIVHVLLAQRIRQSLLLFLDVDGTLANFCIEPRDVVIDTDILTTLMHLNALDNVKLCVVTGRSIADARRLLGDLAVPILGTHGLECCPLAMQVLGQKSNLTHYWDDLQQIKAAVHSAMLEYPALMLEEKTYSLAIHYRRCPQLQAPAHRIASRIVASYPDWQIKFGKCVFEIAPIQADKGLAISRYLTRLDHHPFPVFVGDDMTDENGFLAVQQHTGCGIKVGEGNTVAQYRLANVAAVANFLHHLLERLLDKQGLHVQMGAH